MNEKYDKLAELLELKKQLLNHNSQEKQENNVGQTASHQKTLGAHPEIGKIFMGNAVLESESPIFSSNDRNNKAAFTSAFMLGFIVLLFESLFLLVSFLIFK